MTILEAAWTSERRETSSSWPRNPIFPKKKSRRGLHEIKHDGFRVIARKMKLYSRPGNDLTNRFPLIVEALARLRSRSCIIDGEAVSCGADMRRIVRSCAGASPTS